MQLVSVLMFLDQQIAKAQNVQILCKIKEFCVPFRGGKAPLYDKMVQRNDSIVRNVSKEEWRTKDIVECIFDDNDSECNLKPGTLADLAMVRIEMLPTYLV